ncbi:MAG: hypothetical protein R6V54_01760 [Desulfobacteraceae bacterium]
MKISVFDAAGGNPTAICYDTDCTQNDYPMLNKLIQRAHPWVEQVGFYREDCSLPRLEMAGGEFCGNAARSFACLLKELNPGKDGFQFHISGFAPPVTAEVTRTGTGKFACSAGFKGLDAEKREGRLDGKPVTIVDLGGIVHIMVKETDFPVNGNGAAGEMLAIKNRLGIDGSAVGVVWLREEMEKLYMRPVVWVRDINTCLEESSCGSGTIAVAAALEKNVSVVQPSGEPIDVCFNKNTLVLSSSMEKIDLPS